MDKMEKRFKKMPINAIGDYQMVFGFLTISHKDGKPVVDKGGWHVTDQAIFKSCMEVFIKGNELPLHFEHDFRTQIGTVKTMFPLTREIAKSLDIQTKINGLLIGAHIVEPKAWQTVKSGEVTGLSFGYWITDYSEQKQ